MKNVQCYELFGGIALKKITHFHFHFFLHCVILYVYDNQMLSYPVSSLHVCNNHVYGRNLISYLTSFPSFFPIIGIIINQFFIMYNMFVCI